MDFKEVIEKRRSTRKFEERPVDRATAERLMQAALTAPSARNTRSTRIIATDDRDTIVRMASMRDYGSAFVKNAPLVFIVAGDTAACDLWVDNAAIAATILQLAAVDEGLASCWVHVNGRPHLKEDPSAGTAEQYLRGFVDLPEGWRILCLVAAGYAASAPAPLPEHDDSGSMGWL
ncbi:MAG: nitroreductase family protein [Alistipes sp.]|nr:nitroreductase family protein [Alistipes sp.]